MGSGWGEFAFEAIQRGAIVYGIEPDSELLEISVMLLGKQGTFAKARAEAIPFRDETFDIVICYAVIEHVKDVRACLEEMIRVLRKGGYLYLRAPNYLYPYEGHYKIRWIPLLPKPLAKIHLRLLGRNPTFIQDINYNSNYLYLSRQLKRKDVVVRNLIMEQSKHHLRSRHFLKRLIMALRIYAYITRSIELLIKKT
ncbi:Ubiquinone biosynthesis O-methyltransferase [subsurface metagenome]